MGFSESEAFETMAGALSERGLISSEQIASDRAELNARLGIEPASESEAFEIVASALSQTDALFSGTNTPEAQPDPLDQINQEVFSGPDGPQSYHFQPPPQGVETSLEQERSFRNFFHSEGIPVALATEIGRQWNKSCAEPPDDRTLALGKQEATYKLTQLWGADYEANLAVARGEIDRMAKAQPQIVGMLIDSAMGNSVWLAQTLVSLARAKGRA
jgi:hypothetical protein